MTQGPDKPSPWMPRPGQLPSARAVALEPRLAGASENPVLRLMLFYRNGVGWPGRLAQLGGILFLAAYFILVFGSRAQAWIYVLPAVAALLLGFGGRRYRSAGDGFLSIPPSVLEGLSMAAVGPETFASGLWASRLGRAIFVRHSVMAMLGLAAVAVMLMRDVSLQPGTRLLLLIPAFFAAALLGAMPFQPHAALPSSVRIAGLVRSGLEWQRRPLAAAARAAGSMLRLILLAAAGGAVILLVIANFDWIYQRAPFDLSAFRGWGTRFACVSALGLLAGFARGFWCRRRAGVLFARAEADIGRALQIILGGEEAPRAGAPSHSTR